LAEARNLWLAIGPAVEPARREHDAPARFGRPSQIWALAASLLICTIFGAEALQVYGHDYVTGPGETRAVVLADGARITMSGRSALDVSYKNGARQVNLARGEAYFDVVHDPSRPFSVTAGRGEVRDIGTAFSVRRTGDGATVVVARGEVEVAPAAPGAPSARLTSDQTVAYDGRGESAVRATNASEALSWTQGRLNLENRSLADAVTEINRYYKGRLVLLDGAAGARRINAAVDLERIDDWLAALSRAGKAKVVRVGSLVLLY
jgi:transmembrane sensor